MNESAAHAALIELFRHHPELAVRLVARHGGVVLPGGWRCRVVDPTLRPVNRAGDATIVVEDGSGAAILVIVVEVQLRRAPRKRRTWATYLWFEQDRWDCESRVIVVTTIPTVATWAREPFQMGASVTQVMAIGPLEIPRITDIAEACADPPLAVLSAAMHAGDVEGESVAQAARAAILTLRRNDRWFTNYLVIPEARDTSTPNLNEGLMFDPAVLEEKTDNPQWEWFKRVVAAGMADGLTRREAVDQAHAIAIADYSVRIKAKIQTQTEILLRMLKLRGFRVSPAMRDRMRACNDPAQFTVWLDRVLEARSAAEVFKA